MIHTAFFALITAVLNVATCHFGLTRVRSIRYCVGAFIVNTLFADITAALAITFMHGETTLKYLLYLSSFSYIAYLYLVFEESIPKKLFVMFTTWIFSTIALLIGAPWAAPVSGVADYVHGSDLAHSIRALVQILFLAAVCLWFGKPFKKVLRLVPDRIVSFMSLYPILGFLLLVNNYILPLGHFKDFISPYGMLFFLAFIVLGYVLVFAGVSSASRMISLQHDVRMRARDISERARAAEEQERIISELADAISRVKQLSGLLPICASCKRIRTDDGRWESTEVYIRDRSEADFSHVICPDCSKRLYPERPNEE